MLAFLLICSLSDTRAAIADGDVPVEFQRDAELTDVFFIDPDRGWAVGDRGVVWHTEDGGRHWRLQHAPTGCRLESVWFVNDRTGWAAGGYTRPYSHKSTGVVLRTFDGGEHWEVVPRLSLPRLRKIRFFDNRTGWAAGDWSDMYPAGVFRTVDGGRSWESVPGRGPGGWRAADFSDLVSGVVASDMGAAAVNNRGVQHSQGIYTGGRRIHDIRLVPNTPVDVGTPRLRPGWLVGDGGLVQLTTDGGGSWRAPPGPLPDSVDNLFDFRAIAAWGLHVWIAGTPGSKILHSADAGRSWETLDTGQSLPIHAITFLDDRRGWAVGALGTIMLTRDGGRSWMVQRRGGSRAAMLGLFARSENVPLELIAKYGGNEGFLSVVGLVGRQIDLPTETTTAKQTDRLREAITSVGGSALQSAWQFPYRDRSLRLPEGAITASWDQLHNGGSRQQLEEWMVRAIRTWQPAVVVTEPADPSGSRPLEHLVNQAALAAIEKAGDQAAYPEQLSAGGLQVHRTTKVYGFVGGDVHGTVNLTTSQLAPRLGKSLAATARAGREMLFDRNQPQAKTLGFRLLINRLPDEVGRRDVFGGLNFMPGSASRRQLVESAAGDLRSIGRETQNRRNVEQLLEHLAGRSNGATAWLSQIESLTRELDADASGEILFELGQRFEQVGHHPSAAQAYDLLVKRFPNHRFSEPALVWLVQYMASGEVAWRLQREADRGNTAIELASANVSEMARGVQRAVYQSPLAKQSGIVAPREKSVTQQPGDSIKDRALLAAQYANAIKNGRVERYWEPAIRMPMAVADRVRGADGDAERFFHWLAANGASDAWRKCGHGELWLLQPTRRPPKPALRCTTTSEKPRLDGRLDDVVWQQCTPAPLSSPARDDANWPASVMTACDNEFLYIAIHCEKAANTVYSTSHESRPRDPDLNEMDRVEIYLDIDRDYATYYQLTVDHRGWAAESLAGDSTWNPEWYIAADDQSDHWTVEAAIPWEALAASPPSKNQCWAIGMQRIAPGTGYQSWQPSTSPKVQAQAFGLLMFDGDR